MMRWKVLSHYISKIDGDMPSEMKSDILIGLVTKSQI